MVAKLAIEKASFRHLIDIIVEGDSQVVTNAIINHSSSHDWSIFNILTSTEGIPKPFYPKNSSIPKSMGAQLSIMGHNK